MWASLAHACQSWAALYSDSGPIRTVVGFAHVAGLMIGGGTAIAEDRAILGAGRYGGQHRRTSVRMSERAAHGVVIAGLAVVMASGLMLFAADYNTYLHSTPFWTKMGLVALLLANGLVLARAERDLERNDRAWPRLRLAAAVSLTLWLATTLAGMVLPNV